MITNNHIRIAFRILMFPLMAPALFVWWVSTEECYAKGIFSDWLGGR